jgi:dephospho-CoA kinase
MPAEKKRKYADFVIDTSGTKDDTVEKVKAVYAALRGIGK